MSRTKKAKNQKQGKDFWSRRPLSGESNTTEGKRITNRIERRQRKSEADKAKKGAAE